MALGEDRGEGPLGRGGGEGGRIRVSGRGRRGEEGEGERGAGREGPGAVKGCGGQFGALRGGTGGRGVVAVGEELLGERVGSSGATAGLNLVLILGMGLACPSPPPPCILVLSRGRGMGRLMGGALW